MDGKGLWTPFRADTLLGAEDYVEDALSLMSQL